jgi:hypothetical protein
LRHDFIFTGIKLAGITVNPKPDSRLSIEEVSVNSQVKQTTGELDTVSLYIHRMVVTASRRLNPAENHATLF